MLIALALLLDRSKDKTMMNFLNRVLTQLQTWLSDAATADNELAFNPVPAYLPF